VLPPGEHSNEGGDVASEAACRAFDEPLDLAFDHDAILAAARGWLRRGLLGGDLGATLPPAPIALADLQALFRTLEIPARQARSWAARRSRADNG
jgi:hypothetical protein